jgi:hypothetical protein
MSPRNLFRFCRACVILSIAPCIGWYTSDLAVEMLDGAYQEYKRALKDVGIEAGGIIVRPDFGDTLGSIQELCRDTYIKQTENPICSDLSRVSSAKVTAIGGIVFTPILLILIGWLRGEVARTRRQPTWTSRFSTWLVVKGINKLLAAHAGVVSTTLGLILSFILESDFVAFLIAAVTMAVIFGYEGVTVESYLGRTSLKSVITVAR